MLLRWKNERELRWWENAGRPIPPPNVVKQRTVIDYARRFSLSTFVETGTYYGQMVFAVRNVFRRIYSIELDGRLYEMARRKLSRWRNIVLMQGDSGEVLPELLAKIPGPCLFWLDAHYSGGVTAGSIADTPVKEEVRLILDHPVAGHVILIDDARHLNGQNGYPTANELSDLVDQKWGGGSTLSVEHDIVRIHR